MTDAAIDALQASGIRAVFGRGTVKPPEREGATPYYKLPFPRDDLAPGFLALSRQLDEEIEKEATQQWAGG